MSKENQAIVFDPIAQRKNDHIRICLEEHVDSHKDLFFDFQLTPCALPEMDFNEVSTEQRFLGCLFSMPILITGMTGGVKHGQEINEVLAYSAQKWNIPMGLGSQKIMVDNPHLKNLFDVHRIAPKVFLIGNIGAVSFNYGITVNHIEKLVDTLSLNAFAVHLNALQECIQPEGDRNFSNLLKRIEQLVKILPVPVIVKEVGAGISASLFQQLITAGVAAVDVGGVGGTSWSAIEGYRSPKQGQRLGELFRNWGLSTDEALLQCAKLRDKQTAHQIQLVATGGVRNGLHVAKGVALGATMLGLGLPLFKAAASPPKGTTPLEAVEDELAFFQQGLKIAMFCSGAKRLEHLHVTRRVSKTHV